MTRLFLLFLGLLLVTAVSRAPCPDCAGLYTARYGAGEGGEDLVLACRETADTLLLRLGPRAQALACAPLVLGGDLATDELNRWNREVLEPATRAMSAVYFQTGPQQPVVILLMSDPANYQEAARRLFGEAPPSSFGYYKPHLNTLLVDASRGRSAALHELTHALMRFDFPEARPWLAEGLAALHEECDLRTDPPGLLGQNNWRLDVLRRAAGSGNLPPLAALLDRDTFEGPGQGLYYAQARYLCMYLQRAGVLASVYVALRGRDNRRGGEDARVLLETTCCSSLAQLDQRFRRFLATLPSP